MAKVSVIIPVYNAKENIIACIDSLLNQTLRDLEVILVDDNSSDNGIEQAQNHLSQTPSEIQFKFLKNSSNLGPGLTRNMGLKEAQGDYVIFLDADDWADASMCEKLYQKATKEGADISYCNALAHKDGVTQLLPNPNFKGKEYYLTHFKAYLWTYCFRRAFIADNGIEFPTGKSSEDTYFITCAILASQKMAKVEEALYHYIYYTSSISHKRDLTRWKHKLATFNKLMKWSKEKGYMKQYRCQLYIIYLKKAILTSIKDFLINLFNL